MLTHQTCRPACCAALPLAAITLQFPTSSATESIQQPTMPPALVFDHGPDTALRLVFLDQRPAVSNPSPLFSLINWMPTQATLSHSSRVVPTGCVSKPCQARNQTCQKKTTRQKKKSRYADPIHIPPLSCGGPSSPGTTLSWPRLVSQSSAEQRKQLQLNSIHAAACKHGVGRDGM